MAQAASADAHQRQQGSQDGEARGRHGAHHGQDQLPIQALLSCLDLLDRALTLQPCAQEGGRVKGEAEVRDPSTRRDQGVRPKADGSLEWQDFPSIRTMEARKGQGAQDQDWGDLLGRASDVLAPKLEIEWKERAGRPTPGPGAPGALLSHRCPGWTPPPRCSNRRDPGYWPAHGRGSVY